MDRPGQTGLEKSTQTDIKLNQDIQTRLDQTGPKYPDQNKTSPRCTDPTKMYKPD